MMNKLKDFQKKVIANAVNVKGLEVGEIAPNFTLNNVFGKAISILDYLKLGPVILKFYRGDWCPICNLDLREIQQYEEDFKKYNATIIAISPQKPNDALSVSEKNELKFQVLSDIDQKVIKVFKLQFDPGEDYHARRDLSLLNGNGLRTLPVPATFVINKEFMIVLAHVEADYTQRMPALEILSFFENTEV